MRPLARHARGAPTIREHADANDANRTCLLVVTGIVMTVLLVAIAAEAVGRNPEPFTKALIIVTLALAWLFSNTVYALHYAHLAYMRPTARLRRPRVPAARRIRSIGTSSISPSPAEWRSRRRT